MGCYARINSPCVEDDTGPERTAVVLRGQAVQHPRGPECKGHWEGHKVRDTRRFSSSPDASPADTAPDSPSTPSAAASARTGAPSEQIHGPEGQGLQAGLEELYRPRCRAPVLDRDLDLPL